MQEFMADVFFISNCRGYFVKHSVNLKQKLWLK